MTLQFELGPSLIGLDREGKARLVPRGEGPPPRIDGYVIGYSTSEPDSPPRHGGELHPDADEVLYLISGRMQLLLEDAEGGQSTHELHAGEVVVVPQGVWHRLVTLESSRLLHITPGPHGDWRPLARDG